MAIEMQSIINGFLEGSIRTAGIEPVINELIVSENGTYTAPSGIDGYNPVIVNVPKTPLNKLTVTENGTYTAPTETGYDEVNVNVPLPSNAYLLKEIEDVDIASFSDGSTLPMLKLQVGIEPVQDLHGYDAPWVGGSGKNKIPMTVDGIKALNTIGTWSGNSFTSAGGITFTLLTDADNNIIGIKATGTASANSDLIICDYISLTEGDIINGSDGGSDSTYGLGLYQLGIVEGDGQHAITASEASRTRTMYIRVINGYSIPTNGIIFKPMIRLASVSDSTFAPYSNICPISGHTEVNVVVSPTTDAEDGTTYNIQFKDGDNPLTVYGGSIDVVSGELKVVPYYASYNGETLEGEWISDRDVYAVGTTPTIGAQVVNTGATPQVIQLTPTQIKTLLGNNVITADTGSINNIEYFAK